MHDMTVLLLNAVIATAIAVIGITGATRRHGRITNLGSLVLVLLSVSLSLTVFEFYAEPRRSALTAFRGLDRTLGDLFGELRLVRVVGDDGFVLVER